MKAERVCTTWYSTLYYSRSTRTLKREITGDFEYAWVRDTPMFLFFFRRGRGFSFAFFSRRGLEPGMRSWKRRS